MSLRVKISFILLLLITGFTVISFIIMRSLVFSGYLSFEKQEARKDIHRCIESLRREVFHLNSIANDWAAWNDMYEFVEHPDEDFIKSNLIPETFVDNHLDLICIYDKEKNSIWGQAWDRNSAVQIDLPEFFPEPGPKVFALLNIIDPHGFVSGIFMSSKGPLLVASHPITTSNHMGPIRGHFIMGAFLNSEVIDSLKDSTQVNHQIIPLVNTSGEDAEMIKSFSTEEPVIFNTSHQDRLEAFSLFPDINNRPALLFKTIQPRDILRKGSETLNIALLIVCLSAVIITAALLMLLGKTVIDPISKLTKYVTCIKSTGDSEIQLLDDKKDEIGLLYREFTGMLQRVKNAHEQMRSINEKLSGEIYERKKIEQDILKHRERLRKLSVELQRTEERERRRIANDLHDGIGQKLALMQIKLDALSQNQTMTMQSGLLDELSEFAGEIIHDTRSLTFNISPPVLYDIGLEAAVEWLTDDLSAKYGLRVRVQCYGNSIPLDTAIRVTLYRAIRELLFNAIKHSGADIISVDLSYENDKLRIEVSDNGAGFELFEDSLIRENGFGLFSIRENIKALGGSFDIKSGLGNGSRIILIVPMHIPG